MSSLRILFGAAALFLVITAQALFLLSRCKLRFELAVPISLMLDMLILLATGIIFSNLLIGVCLIIASGVAGILTVSICERKRLREFYAVLCSAGFTVFVVGYVFSWVVSFSQVPHAWDDYGHWLPFVRQMLTYNKLYSEADVYLMKQWYYTPGVSLLQYLSCVLVGSFSECACYAVGTLLMFLSVFPIMKWFEPKSVRIRTFSTLIAFISLYIVAQEDLDGFFLGFRSSYVDIQLSAVTLLLLLWLIFEKDFISKTFCIGVMSAFLTMMKVTGIMFALLGTGTYFLMVVFNVITQKNFRSSVKSQDFDFSRKEGIKHILFALLPILTAVMIYVVWNAGTRPEIEYGSVIGVSENGFVMSVNKFGKGLTLRSFKLSWDWIRTYFYYFFTKEIDRGAALPVASSLFLILFWLVLYLKLKRCKSSISHVSRLVTLGLCVSGGLFVYIIAIGISFYSFSENLETMTSYKRYLSSYMGIIVSLTFVMWLHIIFFDLNSNKRRYSILFMLIFIALVMPLKGIPAVLGKSESVAYKTYYNKMKRWGSNFNSYLTSSSLDARVFLVNTGHGNPDTPSLPAEVAMPGYFMQPIKLQEFSQYRYDPDPGLPFYTEDEFENVLSEYGFSNVVIANYSIPSLGWVNSFKPEDFVRVESLFDVPPEEFMFDAPLCFETYHDTEEHLRLRIVLVENPIT